jgi:hypothetical protein
MPPEFLDRLREAAEAREQEETEYRRESRRRLDALAAERTRAYRRYNLLKDMVTAVCAELPAGIDAQLAVATAASGWHEARTGYADVRERLGRVASAIHSSMHPPTPKSDTPTVEADVAESIAAFEAWYRERFGQDFLDLLGREVSSFQPLVDF